MTPLWRKRGNQAGLTIPGRILKRFERSHYIVVAVGVLWFVLIVTSGLYSWRQTREISFALAVAEAQASYRKDLIYRLWATWHGGVYVMPTETFPPNPYLADLPKRDVITVDGDRLTLVNPAYMTRQVYELAQDNNAILSHITSLNPVRPENAPDAWERQALEAFAKGAKEVRSLEAIGSDNVVRYMRPMFVDAECLKCHAEQHYREGDIRGGISVSVPFAPYLAIEQQQKQSIVLSHALIGLVGLLVLWVSQILLAGSTRRLRESEQRLETLIDSLGEGVVLQDADERIVLWNRTAAEVFDLFPEEVIGKGARGHDWHTIREDGSPFDVQDHPSLHTLRTGVPLSGVIMGVQRGSGETTWIRINTRPLSGGSAALPSAVIISFADITELRRAEQQVQRSEEKFRQLFDNLIAGFALHEMIYDDHGVPVDYRYLEVNPAFERLTGLKAENLLGRTVKSIMPDLEQYWIDIYGKVARTGESVSFQNFSRELDRHYDVWAFSPSRDHFAVVFTDITNRVRADQALADNEKNLRSLFHAIIESVCLFDQDGIIITANKTFAERLGKRVEDCIGMSIIVLDGSYSGVIEDLVRSRVPMQYERMHQGRYYHHSLFPVLDERGLVSRIALFSADITEQQQAEENYRYIFENLQDAVYSATLDGQIIDITPSIRELSGGQYTREELIGTSLIGFYADPFQRETFLRDLSRDGRVNDYEVTLKNKTGALTVCSVSAKIQYDDQGSPEKIIGALRDISDRVAIEGQLQQAQKMESVGRLAGGVAHDFNNMLSVIIGYTDLILEDIEENHPSHCALLEIRKAAQRSADLTGQLLAFARRQAVAPRRFELNDAVSGVLTMLHRLIGEDIDLQWRPDPNSTPVEMDPSQLDQILANLCVNARDAIAGNGMVVIETANQWVDAQAVSRQVDIRSGPYVVLSVSDTGCGMNRETLSHLFEPFYTTKKVGEGTGLGLATVYGIVRQNNGFVDVDSEPGVGTTFRVFLPRLDVDTNQLPVSGDRQEIKDSAKEIVLLVEDEPMVLDLTTRMLERLGYQVLAASSPEEAIRIAEKGEVVVHLLITDVIMPDMNGRDLADRLQRHYPQLKCLFMSGYTADVIAHHGVLDPDVRFIQKPFTRSDLAEKLHEVLNDLPTGR